MIAATYKGLLTDPPSNATASVSTTGSTSNCTFPHDDNGASYMSLGLCSQCNDTSGATQFTVWNSSSDPDQWTCTLSDLGVGQDADSNVVVMNMTQTDPGHRLGQCFRLS